MERHRKRELEIKTDRKGVMKEVERGRERQTRGRDKCKDTDRETDRGFL